MIHIRPAKEPDYELAFLLMRENMAVYHEMHNIPWDQSWVEENYRDKENYSIFCCREWVGFVSVEWLKTTLYVHTLQLATTVQGGLVGARVFDFLLRKAIGKKIFQVECRSFQGNPVVKLYQRLGFEIVDSKGVLIKLRLKLNYSIREATTQANSLVRAHLSQLTC